MKELDQAIKILNADDIVGIPTETVYGLAGRIDSHVAIAKIFKLKERPFFDPLIVHVSSIALAKSVSKNWDEISEVLAEKFWPGSLTLILPKADTVDPMITSGLETVGIRIPNHPLTQELIEKLGCPVAAPSANKFKKTSPTRASHVKDAFKDLYVLDGGECSVGIESTIIQVCDSEVKILRPGMIKKSDIEIVLKNNGYNIPVIICESEIAPGSLKHHYMPQIPLIVQYGEVNDLSSIPPELLANTKYYELDSDPIMVARTLYQKLREFDRESSSIHFKLTKKCIYLDEWQGIINRLNKAATHILSE